MSHSSKPHYTPANTQDDLLLHNLLNFYENERNLNIIQQIVAGESRISLRIIDWFVTNYAKKYETEYVIKMRTGILKDLIEDCVFKVYHRYKLQLKAYSKRKFDSFCRWERISIPCGKDSQMLTTIGQLNFFKWAIDNSILDYIDANYDAIEKDMNSRNSGSSRKNATSSNDGSSRRNATSSNDGSSRRNATSSTESSDTSDATADEVQPPLKSDGKTRKKRQELSVSASKCIKKEMVHIVVSFDK